MLRIIYITGLLIASIANANKQNINKEIKEENPEDFLCSAPKLNIQNSQCSFFNVTGVLV